jgi:exodeoxyribonuclease-3
MRIATWNVNSIGARLPRLVDWLTNTAPDIVCLQETKISDDAFPRDAIEPLGYEVAAFGEGRWNGVAVLSRVGLTDISRGFTGQPGYPPDAPVVEARAVGATCGPIRAWSVYVPNGREPEHDHYKYKLEWLAALRTALADEAGAPGAFAVLGDYNIAPTDEDVWDRAAFEGLTHVTPPEREALTGLRDLGLVDVMPRPLKGPHPFTYWDYRGGNFHKNMGMRIDLVLANQAFAGAVSDAYVDRDARKGTGPSDHAPVVVDVDL